MKRAIIIDDEKLIREGLIDYIDWASLDIQICAAVKDGLSGISAALKYRPHIILADICLPGMDGTAMLEQLRSYGLPCEVIFISSYSEFRYAQKAVHLGAFDYLLKPIEEDVLYQSVRRCAEKIDACSEERNETYDHRTLEKIFTDALTTFPQSGESFFSLIPQSRLGEASPLLLITANASLNQVKECLTKAGLSPDNFLAVISDHILAACIFVKANRENQCLDRLSSKLTAGNLSFTLVPFESGNSLYPAFQSGLIQLLMDYFKTPADDRTCWNEEKQELAADVIKNLDLDGLREALCFYFRFCAQNQWTARPTDFAFECSVFLKHVYQQLELYYGSPLPKELDMRIYLERLQHCNNLWDLGMELYKILRDMFHALGQKTAQSPYTRSALQIIHTCYRDPLSLKSVARQLNISPSHLSSVFKNNTGYPFSDYLFLHRMKTAMNLISEENLKVYEIGILVGYPDVAQFSKCFKKYWGYSPKQLQSSRQLLSDDTKNGLPDHANFSPQIP